MEDRSRNMSNSRVVGNGEGWSETGLSGKKLDMNVSVKMLDS
jgi:hypothetical protein